MRFLISALFFIAHTAFGDTSCATKYPIVLTHGLFGYSGSLGLYPYWSDIPDALRACGATVYVAHVSAANEIYVRGEQLYNQLRNFGHNRYHIIGHSQGGLDARYVLENYPSVVASVTTIGTPHRGSKVADKLTMSFTRGTWMESFANFLGNSLGYAISLFSGHFGWQDTRSAMLGLTTEHLNQFNKNFPVGLGNNECSGGPSHYQDIQLYSWGSEGAKATAYRDWFGHILERFFSKAFDEDEKNDGLVAECSMMWGSWLGSLKNAHHLITVGGIVSPMPDALKGVPEQMFIQHAQRLAQHENVYKKRAH